MSSARLALWTRNRRIGPPDVQRALMEERSVVRASCMRQTLHLLPATEFYTYITALKRSRVEAILRGMSRFGANRKDADRLNEVVLDLLCEGPKTQKEMSKQIRPKVSKPTQAWMDRFWSPVRLAMVEGLVCYGPDRGKDSTIVRADHWLKKQKRLSESESQRFLLRRYLSAYGPASPGDFSRWSGISMKETMPVWNSMVEELSEVSIDDIKVSVLREDYESLLSAKLRDTVLCLLPGFDPYLLAHVEKDHLVDESV
ncbi:MAG TPA: winged helix DNA-binding domain-containing protein, partial [Blastocatellia bacterium]|nr:winged helix DNA-binding domain-containing protein [Blastocatellia bacterium]